MMPRRQVKSKYMYTRQDSDGQSATEKTPSATKRQRSAHDLPVQLEYARLAAVILRHQKESQDAPTSAPASELSQSDSGTVT